MNLICIIFCKKTVINKTSFLLSSYFLSLLFFLSFCLFFFLSLSLHSLFPFSPLLFSSFFSYLFHPSSSTFLHFLFFVTVLFLINITISLFFSIIYSLHFSFIFHIYFQVFFTPLRNLHTLFLIFSLSIPQYPQSFPNLNRSISLYSMMHKTYASIKRYMLHR